MINAGEMEVNKGVKALLAARTLLVEIATYYRKMHEVEKEAEARKEAAKLGDPESISWMTTYLEKQKDTKQLDEMKKNWIEILTSQGIEREANKAKYQVKGG